MTRPEPPTRLQILRAERAWSQEELAEAAGVSTRTVQRLESGAVPSLETSRAIAAAFSIDPKDIFETNVPSHFDSRFGAQGKRWGIGGALLGYAFAIAAVTYGFVSGGYSGFEAGTTLGALGALTGTLCALITWVSRRVTNP